jgi:hypothetical protein
MTWTTPFETKLSPSTTLFSFTVSGGEA